MVQIVLQAFLLLSLKTKSALLSLKLAFTLSLDGNLSGIQNSGGEGIAFHETREMAILKVASYQLQCRNP